MINQKEAYAKTQTVLPFRLETTYEMITPHAGLVLLGEFIHALNLPSLIDKYLPPPLSAVGYKPSACPLNGVVALTILGSLDFIKEIKDNYLKNKKVDHNVPALKKLSKRPSIEEIIKEVEAVFGQDRALSRKVKLYFCHRYTGTKLKEIGTHFGIGESGVSQSSRRITLKNDQDRKLRKKIEEIETKLNLSRV